MQLTRFDRFLRQKFVHETHVYSLRPPETLPAGVRAEELPDEPGRRFRHRYVVRNEAAAAALIEEFKAHNQMFTTRIVDRKAWYTPLVAPRDNKSVTWWCVWMILAAIGIFTLAQAGRALWNDPEFRKNLAETLQIMKG